MLWTDWLIYSVLIATLNGNFIIKCNNHECTTLYAWHCLNYLLIFMCNIFLVPSTIVPNFNISANASSPCSLFEVLHRYRAGIGAHAPLYLESLAGNLADVVVVQLEGDQPLQVVEDSVVHNSIQSKIQVSQLIFSRQTSYSIRPQHVHCCAWHNKSTGAVEPLVRRNH